jgi:hypothetical protein
MAKKVTITKRNPNPKGSDGYYAWRNKNKPVEAKKELIQNFKKSGMSVSEWNKLPDYVGNTPKITKNDSIVESKKRKK